MADAVGGAAKVNGQANGVPSSYSAKFDLQPHFIGGNQLARAPPSKVKDFVTAHDGHTVITNVSSSAISTGLEAWALTSAGMRELR
jgi:acetyl-CoA carboxylase/biotin carboxylase 1